MSPKLWRSSVARSRVSTTKNAFRTQSILRREKRRARSPQLADRLEAHMLSEGVVRKTRRPSELAVLPYFVSCRNATLAAARSSRYSEYSAMLGVRLDKSSSQHGWTVCPSSRGGPYVLYNTRIYQFSRSRGYPVQNSRASERELCTSDQAAPGL